MECCLCNKELQPGDKIEFTEIGLCHTKCYKNKQIKDDSRIYKCPKCNGSGKISRPTKLRSDFDKKDKLEDCELCSGYGKTEKLWKPVYKIVGYRKKIK